MAPKRICVVGGSLAGLRTVEALRSGGYDGTVVVVGQEERPPYNRPPMSKGFLTGEMEPAELALPVRGNLDVDWRLGVRATALSLSERRVETTSGSVTDLDAVVIATGSAARTLDLPRLAGVHTLRTVDDALALREDLLRGGPVAVLGAGLIGCEIASSCVRLGVPATLIDPADIPMERALGRRAGALMAAVHRAAGVDLRLNTSLCHIDGHTRVTGLTLSDGSRVPVDTLVVAVGSRANTDWLEGSGLGLSDGVLCDEYCRAAGASGHVFAVGDVCRWPTGAQSGHTERGEHWTGATEQASIAANTLQHGPTPAPRPIPFFWSEQHHRRLQGVGRPAQADASELIKNTEKDAWALMYTRQGRVVAAAAVDMPGRIAAVRRQLAAQRAPQEALR